MAVLALIVPALHAQIGPYPCGANSSVTTWRNDYAYALGQVVILNGVTYQSLSSGNFDQNPCTFSGTLWSNVIGSSGGGALFPSISGIVYSLSTTSARNATASDVNALGPLTLPNGTTATTQTAGDNSLNVATTAYVATAIPAQTFPAAGIMVSTGTSFAASVAAPTGTIVGTTDTQTLTNKSIAFTEITGSPSTTQVPFQSLTTTGTSGAATLIAGVLNIPTITGGGGSGTVTTFSAGTLSPLFTTSVATATTTPSLTFTLTAAAANTVFGNFTGSSAAPTFTAAPTFSAANLTNVPACSTCATSANNLGFFAATTSAQLAGVVSDESGSGALVFGTSPTIATPTVTGLITLSSTAAQGPCWNSDTALFRTSAATLAVGTSCTSPNASGTFSASSILFGLIASVSGVANGSIGQGGSAASMTLQRNVADAFTAVTIKQTNASSTGHIVDFVNSGGTVGFLSQAGAASFPNITDTALAVAGIVTNTSAGLFGTVVAPTGTIVGTTDTQTLTNKTIVMAGVNAQVGTTYTVLAADSQKLVTLTNAASVAVTLPVASTAGFTSGFVFRLKNNGAGTVTITPTTSNIDGNTTLVLVPLQGVELYSDGTNYQTSAHYPFVGSAIPTVVAGSGAGVSATTTLTAGSTNASGQIVLNTGASGVTNNSVQVTLTFANGGFKGAEFCQLTSSDFNSSNAGVNMNGSSTNTQLFLFTSGSALSTSQTYHWNYSCP